MLSLAFSAAMLGIEGYVVRVEADSSAGTPSFSSGFRTVRCAKPAIACAPPSSIQASRTRPAVCS